eukprot:COSAG02_NODE_7273_length_3088_cov_2.490800_2_plen_119_part_00
MCPPQVATESSNTNPITNAQQHEDYEPPSATFAADDSPSEPSSVTADDVKDPLASALAQHNLSQFEPALRELGISSCADVSDLEEADCAEIGMKKFEIKRFMKMKTLMVTEGKSRGSN